MEREEEEMTEKKRSVRIWIYGIAFLILGQISWNLLTNGLIGMGIEGITGDPSQDLMSILFINIPSFLMWIIGISILLRKCLPSIKSCLKLLMLLLSIFILIEIVHRIFIRW